MSVRGTAGRAPWQARRLSRSTTSVPHSRPAPPLTRGAACLSRLRWPSWPSRPGRRLKRYGRQETWAARCRRSHMTDAAAEPRVSTRPTGPVAGPDGRLRCPWGLSAPEYVAYHDDEWGRLVHGDQAIFERLCLEAFQSGLSWLIILRKRENFRKAFAGFDIEQVAAFTDADATRLLADAGIVRNRAKINAAINNARAALAVEEGLSDLFWSYAEPGPRPAPKTLADVPGKTPQSTALAK